MPLPTYLMSNFPSVRPSLNLQFDSQPTPEDMTSHLASVGATFSRASIGTYTDANGLIQEASAGQARPNYSTAGVHEGLLIEESRTNLIKSSEDFSTNFWTLSSGGTGSSPIVTVNQGIAPDGTASADRIQFDLNGGSSSSDISVLTTSSSISVSNGDHTISVYLKSYDGSSYDLTFGSNNADVNLNKITVTSEWQRFDVLHDATGSSTNFYFGLRNAAGVSGLSDTADILIWGAQIEEGSFPTSYIPTIPTFSSRASTATYFDSSGVLQTASIDEARTDHKYIDGQWVEAGLLLEASATNLLPYSTGTTGWSISGVGTYTSSASGSQTDLAGGTDAVRWQATVGSTSSDRAFFRDSFVVGTAGDFTLSFFAKSYDGTDYKVKFHYAGGSTGSITVTDRWQRFEVSGSTTTGTRFWGVEIQGNTVTSDTDVDILVYGFQVETGSQPTSYIPTSGSTATRSADVYTTATKTRSADVCYIDGTAFTDFYNQEQGTFLGLFLAGLTNDLSFRRIFQVGEISSGDFISSQVNNDNLRHFNRESSSTLQIGSNYSGVNEKGAIKFAVSHNSSALKITNDGGAIQTLTDDVNTSMDGLGIGKPHNSTSSVLNGSIKKLIYFPRQLSDNELIKLTQ